MSTSDDVRDLAIALARTETDQDRAVHELETLCAGRRVSAVRARQLLLSSLGDGPPEPDTARAIQLLDELLERLPA